MRTNRKHDDRAWRVKDVRGCHFARLQKRKMKLPRRRARRILVGCVVRDSLADLPSRTAGNRSYDRLFNGGCYCGQEEEEGCQEVSQEKGEEEEVVSPGSNFSSPCEF